MTVKELTCARRYRLAALIVLLFSVFSMPGFSQEEPSRRKISKLWKVSLVALAGATAVDAASSWNRSEANPILRSSNGQFGTQGATIKIGLAGAVAVTQYFLARRGPKAKRIAAIANFSAAGAFGAAAVHNWSQSAAPNARRN